MTRKIFAAALWICCLSLGPAAAREGGVPEKAGPNLLTGGDFESGALAQHWNWDDNQGGTAITEGPGRNGGKAAQLVSTKSSGRAKFSTKPFNVKVGSDLRVTVWVKTEDHLGGAWATLEGKAAAGGQEFHVAGGSADWTRYEYRTTVAPKNGKPGESLPMTLWFYLYGTGTMRMDDVAVEVITPDAEKLAAADKAIAEKLAALQKASTKSPAWSVLATDGLRRVFRDQPFRGAASDAIHLEMLRHEYEGAQVLIFAHEGDLTDVNVSVEGLDGLRVEVLPVAYGDRGKAPPVPWYADGYGGHEIKTIHWPDPLLPNRAFTVQGGTVQPVYLRVYAPKDLAPGEKTGLVKITTAKGEASLPIKARVHEATMPTALKLRTMSVAGPKDQASIDLALQQRMGIGTAFTGMSWTNPTLKPKGDSFDFSEVEKRLQYSIDRGLNAFALAQTPKSGKWGFPKEYAPQWKEKMSKVIKEYGAWLKTKGWLRYAYYNNIDEPWDNRWEQVKDLYTMSKKANPEVKVFSCVNKVGALEALKNHADTYDVYVQHHYQQQAPARKKDGKEIWWAVCIWPDEHPNLFIEFPLIDARVIGWMAFQQDIDGFEYWALSSYDGDWKQNGGKAPKDASWQPAAGGVLTTAWPYPRNRAGDGYLIYPGDEGKPVNSLRFECLRDGLEDHQLLVMLREKLPSLNGEAKAHAEKLLDGGDGLVTNAHLYAYDPARLLDARRQVLTLLGK